LTADWLNAFSPFAFPFLPYPSRSLVKTACDPFCVAPFCVACVKTDCDPFVFGYAVESSTCYLHRHGRGVWGMAYLSRCWFGADLAIDRTRRGAGVGSDGAAASVVITDARFEKPGRHCAEYRSVLPRRGGRLVSGVGIGIEGPPRRILVRSLVELSLSAQPPSLPARCLREMVQRR